MVWAGKRAGARYARLPEGDRHVDMTLITKVLGGLIMFAAVVFAVLFVASFIELPFLSDVARSARAMVGL